MEIIVIIFLILAIIGGVQSIIEKSKISAAVRAAKNLLSEPSFSKMLDDLKKLKEKFHTHNISVNLENHDKYIEEKKEYVGGIQKNCPTCKVGILVQRKGVYGRFYGCSTYPKCKHTQKRIQRIKTTRTINPVFNKNFIDDLHNAYQIK